MRIAKAAKKKKPQKAQSPRLLNFLTRARSTQSFWSLGTSQKKPSWFDDPRILEPYQKKRKSKARAVRRQRRTRYIRGQNPRTGASHG